MLKLLNHFSTALQNYISPTDTELRIPAGVAKKLNDLEVGDHTLLSLVNRNGRSEIVKYTHTKEVTGDTITVERGAQGTGSMNFPAGTCLTAEITPFALDEYVAQVLQGVVAPLQEQIETLKKEVASLKKTKDKKAE